MLRFVFDLEDSIGAIRADTVLLNDIVENIRIVPLETSDEALTKSFHNSYSFVATDKYFRQLYTSLHHANLVVCN
jgi:hypothetical protein